jgi:hypothetical protein
MLCGEPGGETFGSAGVWMAGLLTLSSGPPSSVSGAAVLSPHAINVNAAPAAFFFVRMQCDGQMSAIFHNAERLFGPQKLRIAQHHDCLS